MTNPKDRIGAQKVPLGLIPPAALAHTAVAMYDGASKYGRWNWRSESVAASVYIDACLRHILDWYHGEEIADDSQAHHLGHAIACLAIILDAQGTENLIDDRPAVNQNCSKIFAQLSEKIKRVNELRESAKHVTRNEQKKDCCYDMKREILFGHQVDFIDENQGYIDGEYSRGTDFTQKVALYRSGYQNIDDRLAEEYRRANGCEQPAT